MLSWLTFFSQENSKEAAREAKENLDEAGSATRQKSHDAVDYVADRVRDAEGVVEDRAVEVKDALGWVGEKARGGWHWFCCAWRLLLLFWLLFHPHHRSLRSAQQLGMRPGVWPLTYPRPPQVKGAAKKVTGKTEEAYDRAREKARGARRAFFFCPPLPHPGRHHAPVCSTSLPVCTVIITDAVLHASCRRQQRTRRPTASLLLSAPPLRCHLTSSSALPPVPRPLLALPSGQRGPRRHARRQPRRQARHSERHGALLRLQRSRRRRNQAQQQAPK